LDTHPLHGFLEAAPALIQRPRQPCDQEGSGPPTGSAKAARGTKPGLGESEAHHPGKGADVAVDRRLEEHGPRLVAGCGAAWVSSRVIRW
jgi:hypothetical protein